MNTEWPSLGTGYLVGLAVIPFINLWEETGWMSPGRRPTDLVKGEHGCVGSRAAN